MQTSATQATEQLILQAAEREFLSKGFAGARTTSIAEKAGVTHAMLHYYFRTKEKLFERILNDKIELLKEAITVPATDDSTDIEDVIKNIIIRHLDFLATNPDLPRFIIGEINSGSERSKSFINQIGFYGPKIMNELQNRIDKAAATGRIRAVDARMLMLDVASLNIFSFLAAPVVRVALDNPAADMQRFIEQRKKDNTDTIMRKLRP